MKILILLMIFCSFNAQADVNIYTDRAVELLKPLADEFESKQGVRVNIVNGSSNEIIDRVEAEGENTFADLIFVKDMVYLNTLTDKGLFQAFSSQNPISFVDEAMRHPENLWTAVTIRPRTLVYNKVNSRGANFKNYVDLADESLKGKLCLRTSNSTYNTALVSSLIHNMGYESAKSLLSGWVANLNSEAPTGNDRAALDLVASGSCDVAVVNSYYLTGKLQDDPAYPVALTFADQGSGGVHMNGAGIGLSAFSKNPTEANAFIDYILSDKAQLHLANEQGDYPSKMGLLPETLVREWGVFETDAVNWSVLGLQHKNAKKLFEEIGYL